MPDRLPIARKRVWWQCYGAAIPAVAAAAALTALIPALGREATFVTFFAAVALTAAFRGLGPGLFAMGLSAVTVNLFFVGPAWGPELGAGEIIRLGVFVASGSLMGFLADMHLREADRQRAQREWAHVTLSSIGDAVMVTDADGRIVFMNGVAEELTGWNVPDARGEWVHDVFRIVNERTRATVEDPVARVRREGKVVGLANHTVLLARDGREVPIDDSGAPIWSEDGRLAGAVLVFRDIADRKKAERERTLLLESETRARAEAEAANRAKDEFLATLSHELRTPLNAILGWTQVLRDGTPEPEELRRGLDVIERNVRRQTRLIEDVLDVSRIVSGNLRLEFERVEMERVVEAALEVVRPALEAKRIEIAIEAEDTAPVLGDAERLQQVIWNLLSNAVKFTPPGGRIGVRLRRVDAHVEVSVQDSGHGIGPEFLPHVFDRFRQEEGGTTRPHGGLGLGLAIVRHLVEMHGGRVDAASAGLGEGSTFTVRLPVASGGPPPRERGEAASPPPAPDLAGLRVLAVDDEADARELVAAMLGRAGADVRTAASVAEALEMVAAWEPEVLVSDIEMPGADGYMLLHRLRDAVGAEIPAVALTAYAGAEDRVRALQAGFQLHLPKPVGQTELQLVVASAARWRSTGWKA